MILICNASGDRSDTPVMLSPGFSSDLTIPAPTGSVTALNTTGISVP